MRLHSLYPVYLCFAGITLPHPPLLTPEHDAAHSLALSLDSLRVSGDTDMAGGTTAHRRYSMPKIKAFQRLVDEHYVDIADV